MKVQPGVLAGVDRRQGVQRLQLLPAAGFVLMASLIVIFPLVASPYLLALGFSIAFYTATASSWNIFSGLTGYVNFGYAGLIGLGAYTSAILIVRNYVHWLVAVLIAGVLVAVVAVVVGFPLLRLRGVYFAIATVATAEGFRLLVGSPYLTPLTLGGVGIPFTSGVALRVMFYAIGTLAFLTTVATYLIARSKFGRQLLAIRDDELALLTLGINATSCKLIALAISAFTAGIAGGLQAMYLHFVDPPTIFNIGYTIKPMVMTLFGGPGTVFGPAIGAFLFAVISELLWSQFLFVHLILFGAVLVFIVLFLPDGIIPRLQGRRLLPRVRGV